MFHHLRINESGVSASLNYNSDALRHSFLSKGKKRSFFSAHSAMMGLYEPKLDNLYKGFRLYLGYTGVSLQLLSSLSYITFW